MLQNTKKNIYYTGAVAVFIFYFILLNTSHAQTFQLVDKSIFRESEKSSIIIRPRFIDYTTSLILYVSNGDTPETWTYEPETLGFGYFLLSDYFSFGSPSGRYLLVEYKNDKQTFSCVGLSINQCIANPHFINQSSFEVTTDQTLAAIAATITLATTTTATATATGANETGIIPSIINGVLDFFGINTGTTTTATTEISPADSTSASSTETTPLPQGEIISPPVATTTQVSRVNSFLAAAVVLWSLKTDNMLIAIAVLGILFLLAFMFYRTNKTSTKKTGKNKTTKK